MCGIVGIYSKNFVKDKLIDNLKRLEYRGYDSAGLALLCSNKIETVKAVGKISELEAKAAGKSCDSFIGIGHTRWATHGKPSVKNAHPQLSQDGSWAVVHNGIIENFEALKKDLEDNGFKFKSDTDTEVVSNMLQSSKKKGVYALIEVCKKLQGSYSFACLHVGDNAIFLAKYNSPLYVGEKDGDVVVASACMSNNSYCLNNMEFARVDDRGITFFNAKGNKIEKEAIKISARQNCEENKLFPHHMLKEINDIPKALRETFDYYADGIAFQETIKLLKNCSSVKIVACGTAYHAGLLGSAILRGAIKKDVLANIASEFKYNHPILKKDTLCIFVSQSGETADTIACLKMCKDAGCKTVAITNVLSSTITVFADIVLPTLAGEEVAVASTKAYNCQVLLFRLLAEHFMGKKPNVDLLIEEAQKLVSKKYLAISKRVAKQRHVLYFGRREDFYLAQEASLKLREITYIYSNAQPLGELKHGTLALIDKNSLSVIILTQRDLISKVLSNIFQIKARGGKIILITPFKELKEVKGLSCSFIIIPEAEYIEQLAIIPTQLLAYYTSQDLGINPDKPRNLAKSVTVE